MPGSFPCACNKVEMWTSLGFCLSWTLALNAFGYGPSVFLVHATACGVSAAGVELVVVYNRYNLESIIPCYVRIINVKILISVKIAISFKIFENLN